MIDGPSGPGGPTTDTGTGTPDAPLSLEDEKLAAELIATMFTSRKALETMREQQEE